MIEDNAVQPGTERWTQLVTEARAKDAARNWFLGDAALEIAPMGGNNNGTDDVEGNLRKFAEEIGVAYRSLCTYRDVASAWPSPTRVGNVGWSVHRELAAHQHLIRDGMTVAQAQAAVESERVKNQPPVPPKNESIDVPKEQEQKQEPKHEPKLKLVKDSQSVTKSESTYVNNEVGSHEEPTAEVSEDSQSLQTLHDLLYTATDAVHVASRELPSVVLSDESREGLLRGVQHLERLVTLFREQLSGVSLDEEIRKLMETGS
jgi:hypothetical protein